MAGDTRDRMIRAATDLFRDRGYDGTGFREVVDHAETARGVIYHHFPAGKSELALSVVESTGGRIADRIEAVCLSATPQEAIVTLVAVIDRMLVRGQTRPGCPVVAVTMAAEDPQGELRRAGRAFFDRLRVAVTGCLVRDGVETVAAQSFSTMAVAACEGAIILCRAESGPDPLRQVREALLAAVESLPHH